MAVSGVTLDAEADDPQGDGEPLAASDTLEDCSKESLQAVGAVTLETLDAITRQLVKIDHFAKTSSPEVVEPLEIPLGLTELPRVAEDAVPAQETDEPTRSDVLTDPQEDPEAGVVPAGSPADALARDGEI